MVKPLKIGLVNEFKDRLAQIEARIEAACQRAGRARGDVRMMAVSKVHPVSAIAEAIAAGVTLFGENRVQEFQAKSVELAALGITGADFHLIGHLQSNKAAKAAELFSAIDTVDSLRLAEKLNESAVKFGSVLPILLEIKLSDEPSKDGLDPAGTELRQILDRLTDLHGLAMRGLMTIAPLDDDPKTARACFRTLRQLRDVLCAAYPKLDWGELSMGMSGDFEIAIEEGSTLVRIGTALFGKRAHVV